MGNRVGRDNPEKDEIACSRIVPLFSFPAEPPLCHNFDHAHHGFFLVIDGMTMIDKPAHDHMDGKRDDDPDAVSVLIARPSPLSLQ